MIFSQKMGVDSSCKLSSKEKCNVQSHNPIGVALIHTLRICVICVRIIFLNIKYFVFFTTGAALKGKNLLPLGANSFL